jgi:ADP-ribosylglycohydrolase
MHGLLPKLASGANFQVEAPALFGGQGSFGNGAAMRVAPLGAYFADDLAQVVAQARLSG